MSEAVKEGAVILAWSPVKDGDYIPSDPVENGFPEQAKNIPLMIGSCLNEWATVPLFANMAETQSGGQSESAVDRFCENGQSRLERIYT